MERIIGHLKSTNTTAPEAGEVLIISDDPLLSLDLKMSLTGQGYATQTSGFSAASDDMPKGQHRFSGVILDIHSPDVTSDQLLAWLMSAGAPVIVLSTFDQATVPGLPPGTVWYTKPLSVDDVDARTFTAPDPDQADVA